ERLHQSNKSVELFTRARHLEDKALRCRINNPSPEDIGEAERLDASLAFASYLDQRHLALDKGPLVRQVVDLTNRYQPRQLRLDLFDDHPRSRGDDRYPRQVVALIDLGDGQTLDIVAAPREQSDDTGENPRLVVDEHGEGMPLDLGHAGLRRAPSPLRKP